MRYRVTCLTPVLVGDGRRLSPIDYMVWKDQINVLDQQRKGGGSILLRESVVGEWSSVLNQVITGQQSILITVK